MDIWNKFLNFFIKKPEHLQQVQVIEPKDNDQSEKLFIWAPLHTNKKKIKIETFLSSLPYFFGTLLEDHDIQSQLLAVPRDGFLITASRNEDELSPTHRRWLLVFLANNETIIKVNIRYSQGQFILAKERKLTMLKFIEEQELNLIHRPIFVESHQIIEQMPITPNLPYPFINGMFNLGLLSQKTLIVDVDRKIPVFELNCNQLDSQLKENVYQEAKKMLNFGSVRIWRLWSILYENNSLKLVLEDIIYGALIEYVSSSRRTFSQLKRFSLQMSEGLRYLEKFDFIHYRLALDCFLITYSANIKLAIFGFSDVELVYSEEKIEDFERHRWIGPENLPIVFTNNNRDDNIIEERTKYNLNSMIYTFGNCLYSLFHGGILPYEDEVSDNISNRQWRVENELMPDVEYMPKNVIDICRKCWKKPEKRPTFKQLKIKLRKVQDSYNF